jgi:hypothetical protein
MATKSNERVLALIAQAESFATELQLMALALEELPKERAGAIAANATEIVARMGELRDHPAALAEWQAALPFDSCTGTGQRSRPS